MSSDALILWMGKNAVNKFSIGPVETSSPVGYLVLVWFNLFCVSNI